MKIKTLLLFLCLLISGGCGDYKKDPNLKAGSLRVISLSPSATELLFALGLDKEIVGLTTFCNYPKEALNKEKIGSFLEPNAEKIISLKPDLVIGVGNIQSNAVEKLKELGLKVYIYNPKNLKGFFEVVNSVGNLTGRKEKAKHVIDSISLKIKKIQDKVALILPEKNPKVYVELSSDPLISAGKGSFIDEMITLAGGVNIAHDLKQPYSMISPEIVIKRNPDFIFLGSMIGREDAYCLIKNRFGWEKINAVKNNKFFCDIDPNLFLRIGPRVADGIEMFNKRIYPVRESRRFQSAVISD